MRLTKDDYDFCKGCKNTASMSDEVICKAFSIIDENTDDSDESALEGFVTIDPSSFIKSSRSMICVTKERYYELLEIEAMYNDLCK